MRKETGDIDRMIYTPPSIGGFSVDDLRDACRAKMKSMRMKFAFVEIEEKFESHESEFLSQVILQLRKMRSSKSAKSELCMKGDRVIKVSFWEEGDRGWRYNFSAEGRPISNISPEQLLNDFLKSFVMFGRGDLNEKKAEEVWSNILLNGPFSLIK